MLRAFCRPQAYTFNEQSKMATALTPQIDVTSESHVTDGEPETAVSASLQKTNRLKTNINIFFIIHLIKSQVSDSFANDFDGHFAYLKTLDFYFKPAINCVMN